MSNRPNPEVDVIVVTDGERILGIGNQGADGLGILSGSVSWAVALSVAVW